METQFPYQNQIAVMVGIVNCSWTLLSLTLVALSNSIGDEGRLQRLDWLLAPVFALLLLSGDAVRDLLAIPRILFIQAQATGILSGMLLFLAGAEFYNYRNRRKG